MSAMTRSAHGLSVEVDARVWMRWGLCRNGDPDALFVAARRLTRADREVLPLLCAGLSDPQIGAQLHLSRAGVKSRVRALCRRLRASNRTQAVHIAYIQGILAVPEDPPRLDEQFTPVWRYKPVVRVPLDPPEVIAARVAVLLGEEG